MTVTRTHTDFLEDTRFGVDFEVSEQLAIHGLPLWEQRAHRFWRGCSTALNLVALTGWWWLEWRICVTILLFDFSWLRPATYRVLKSRILELAKKDDHYWKIAVASGAIYTPEHRIRRDGAMAGISIILGLKIWGIVQWHWGWVIAAAVGVSVLMSTVEGHMNENKRKTGTDI